MDGQSQLQLPAYPILVYFNAQHLPPMLQAIASPFCDLAHTMARQLPHGPEVSASLRKLLEAKDCAVRAAPDL